MPLLPGLFPISLDNFLLIDTLSLYQKGCVP